MSSVVISGDTSGSITLAAPAVAGTNTITLPASTGTIMVNGPAFSAYMGTDTSLSSNTYTKIPIDTEDFDTNNNFASNRFTPTVAGYYQISGGVNITSTSTGLCYINIYKNGSLYKRGNQIPNTTGNYVLTNISVLVYMNGSTDYLELYALQSSAVTLTMNSGSTASYFTGAMIRSA